MKRKRAAKTGPSKNRRIEEAANNNERATSDSALEREQPAPAHNQQERGRTSGTGSAVEGIFSIFSIFGFDDADSSDDPDGDQQFGAGAHAGNHQLPANSRSRLVARP
ncbi:hypothetical protein QAD02_000951 [Eretmocerus hayati]|uniref:Uncharacterized protein n=1 Tax=Eretmocerus hayati TaxID=131215 RepID=A0ACC2NEV8_9HYME|nr:hypothetical protein QAD02_000951 [Eretmocerus hayati]